MTASPLHEIALREARILLLAERARQRLPLFEDGPPAPLERNRPACLACDKPATWGRGGHRAGWLVIPVPEADDRHDLVCPECQEV